MIDITTTIGCILVDNCSYIFAFISCVEFKLGLRGDGITLNLA